MSTGLGATDPVAKRRPAPVTDPVRIAVVDPAPANAAALAREIDLDRELAVVACCTNLKRAAGDIDRCKADLVAVRLGLDDPQCVALLTALAGRKDAPCVVVLGAPNEDGGDAPAGVGRLKARIREVAEASFGIAPMPARGALRLH